MTRNKLEVALFVAIPVLLIVLIGYGASLDGDARRQLIQENGVVEAASAALYFVVTGVLLVMGGKWFLARFGLVALIPVLMGMRELDWHKQFTHYSIFNKKYYTTAMTTPVEKLVGAAAVLLLVVVAILIVRRHGRDFLRELRARSILAVCVILAGATAVLSKLLDGLPRRLNRFGFDVPQWTTTHGQLIEEVLELGIPMFLAVAAIHFLRRSDGSGGLSTPEPVSLSSAGETPLAAEPAAQHL